MNDAIEGATSGAERIKSRQTVAEVLTAACSFEATARDFYTQLIPQVSERMHDIVAELAAEEQRHHDLLSELAARADIAERIQDMVDTPASQGRFIDATHFPDLTPYPDDQALLQYAIGREALALEQYQALAQQAPEGPIKDTFDFLAKEEAQHKADLERLYAELIEPH